MGQRKAVTKAIATRYARASKLNKRKILDEACATIGWHRNHVRTAPGAALRPRVVKPRPPRRATHGEDVAVALRCCWIVLGAAADKWTAPFLSELVAKLRICGELKISDEMATLLSAMSAATIDRKLGPERAKLDPRGRSHTKPGSLLKYQISINKFEVSVRLPRYLLGSQRFLPARLPGPRGQAKWPIVAVRNAGQKTS